MNAPKDHQEGTSATPPQEAPGNAASPPNTNASIPDAAYPSAAAEPSEGVHEDERPTPPRIPRVRKRSGSFGRHHLFSSVAPPAAPAPTVPPPSEAALPPAVAQPAPAPPTPAPEPGLADLEWMPPAEDRVARFLSDVAEIQVPQPREREANARLPLLPLSASPAEAERKKARAEPFLSQVHATPMAPARKVRARRRQRHLLVWLAVILALLLLALLAVMLALPHLHL